MKDALIVALACLAVYMTGRDFFERHRLEQTRHELAVMKTEKLEAEAQAAGWRTRLVEAGSIGEQLQVAKTENGLLLEEKQDLARQVATLGGQVRVLTDMYAEAVGQIEAREATLHTSGPDNLTPDSVTGHVDDGLLSADVTATVDPPTVAIPRYSLTLALVTAVSETADGRALFTARAADPRVTLSFGDVYWQPPAPIERCGFWCHVRAGLWGAVVVEGGRVIFDAVRGG